MICVNYVYTVITRACTHTYRYTHRFFFCFVLLIFHHFRKGGESRKNVVTIQKRQIVADAEDKFQSAVFQLTTDDDMPEYTQFDFAS